LAYYLHVGASFRGILGTVMYSIVLWVYGSSETAEAQSVIGTSWCNGFYCTVSEPASRREHKKHLATYLQGLVCISACPNWSRKLAGYSQHCQQ